MRRLRRAAWALVAMGGLGAGCFYDWDDAAVVSTTTATTTTTSTATCSGCGSEQRCRFADGLCGAGQTQPVCAPGADPADKARVCGCDARVYATAVDALAAGVDVGPSAACSTECGAASCDPIASYCRLVEGKPASCEPMSEECAHAGAKICDCLLAGAASCGCELDSAKGLFHVNCT